MRRLLATLALVAATSAAPLGVLCQWQCVGDAHHAKAPAAAHCHEADAAEPGVVAAASGSAAVTAGEQCGVHDQLPAITEWRRTTVAASAPVAVAPRAFPASSDNSWVVVRVFDSPPGSSPPVTRISVLRI